jgi:hypothetical protein
MTGYNVQGNVVIHLPCLFVMTSDILALRADTWIGLQVGCGTQNATERIGVWGPVNQPASSTVNVMIIQRRYLYPGPATQTYRTRHTDKCVECSVSDILVSNVTINRFQIPRS